MEVKTTTYLQVISEDDFDFDTGEIISTESEDLIEVPSDFNLNQLIEAGAVKPNRIIAGLRTFEISELEHEGRVFKADPVNYQTFWFADRVLSKEQLPTAGYSRSLIDEVMHEFQTNANPAKVSEDEGLFIGTNALNIKPNDQIIDKQGNKLWPNDDESNVVVYPIPQQAP